MVERGPTCRLFVGIPVEGELRDRVIAMQEAIRSRARGWQASWVPAENLHLTLKFLGSVRVDRVDDVGRALSVLATLPVPEVELFGLGSFPERGPPRVLFVGVRAGAPDLGTLAEAVEGSLETLGFSRETRAFHPHVTLARVRKASGRCADVIDPDARIASLGRFVANEVVLFESVPRPPSTAYVPRLRIRLDEKDLQSPPR